MASCLHILQGNITRNFCKCLKKPFSTISPYKTRWRSITTLSFNTGFAEEVYEDVQQHETGPKPLDLNLLKQKEKGDWRNLTLQEKQALYYMSFSQPFCDIEQPADEWKLILAGTFTAMGLMTLALYMWLSRLERAENDVTMPLSLQISSTSKEDMSMFQRKESPLSS